jgi:hypothetical protein
MGTPFLGEVKMTSFNFAPKGWVLANGDLLPINQNQASSPSTARPSAATDRRPSASRT